MAIERQHLVGLAELLGAPRAEKAIANIRKRLARAYTGNEDCIEWHVTVRNNLLVTEPKMPGLPKHRWPETYSLSLPVTVVELAIHIESVADAASAIWRLTCGCDDCGEPDTDGLITVNLECATCAGEGSIR